MAAPEAPMSEAFMAETFMVEAAMEEAVMVEAVMEVRSELCTWRAKSAMVSGRRMRDGFSLQG